MNISDFIISEYEQMDTWSNGKNKAKTKPIQTQFKANTKPKQTQFKPKQSQFQTLPCKNRAHKLKYVDRLAQLTLNLKKSERT
jgi:hypothetical protein